MAQEKLGQKKVETGGKAKAEVKAPTIKPKVATGVTVVHGPLLETYDLSGATVEEAVDMLKGPLGIDPNVNPLVNGEEAENDLVLSDGDTLEFVRGAGEKGADHTIHVTRSHAWLIANDGGQRWKVPSPKLATQVFKAEGHGLLHPFTRMYESIGSQYLTVLEIPPHCRTVRWISGEHDTPERAQGMTKPPGTRYETRFLSFPWIIILFSTEDGRVTGHQELFYRTEPLRPGSTDLLLSNMCNVANGYGWKAWLCLQHLGGTRPDQYGLSEDIIHHALNAAFNRSSEIHEGNSGWNRKMRALDPRLKNLAVWEKASKKEPGFIMKVRWPSAETTLEQEVNEFRERSEGSGVNLFQKLHRAGMRVSR